MLFALKHGWEIVKEGNRSYFPFSLHFASSRSLKVGSTSLLFEKGKQYPVLYDKQMKEYREKDAARNARNTGVNNVKLIEIGESKLILFFMLYLG